MTNELREHIKAHLNWGSLSGPDKLRFMVLALCGEAGELANLIKKDWRGDAGDRRQELIEELADVGNYAFMIAEGLGINLQSEMLAKLKAFEERPSWKAHAQRDLIDRLVQGALGILHHDRTDGSEVDHWERDQLRKKFSEILTPTKTA